MYRFQTKQRKNGCQKCLKNVSKVNKAVANFLTDMFFVSITDILFGTQAFYYQGANYYNPETCFDD